MGGRICVVRPGTDVEARSPWTVRVSGEYGWSAVTQSKSSTGPAG